MSAADVTTWFQKNAKGVLITTVIAGVVIAIGLTLYKIFGKPKGTGAPDVSNPETTKAELDRMTAIYQQYKPALTKDELYYKSIADSLQAYLQSTTFYFSSDVFGLYFADLDVAAFVAVYYFWGPSREYTGSWFNNPFQGIGDKFGNLTEALKARITTADFQKIQQKFQTTGLI